VVARRLRAATRQLKKRRRGVAPERAWHRVSSVSTEEEGGGGGVGARWGAGWSRITR
jgi:hypothetical protein